MRRVVHKNLLAVRFNHLIANRGRGSYNFKTELPLYALLHNFHMQKPQKPATETEAQRDRAVGFENKRRVVKL